MQNITICGAGTMGGGIAISCLSAGLNVLVIDNNAEALSRVKSRIDGFLSRQVSKGRLSEGEAQAQQQRLSLGQDLSGAASADLVIEAVFEDLEVKRQLLAALAPHLSDHALVATNTSALRVDDLAAVLPDQSRFFGLHYFSPAEINPVVEVVSGSKTSIHAREAALGFVKQTGKIALSCKDAPGFAVNRFFCPYSNEAVRILEEGIADAASIDQVACDSFGLALGPFAVMNIIKPRINMNAVQNLSGLGQFYHPAALLVETGSADAEWDIGTPQPLAEPVANLIRDRLRAALFLPVLEALGDDVAAPDDFDLGAERALRFAQGPVARMRALGKDAVAVLVEQLCKRENAPFPHAGFDRLFATGTAG